MFFDPDVMTKTVESIQRSHSPACKMISDGEWPLLMEMYLIDQDHVGECQHRSHDSVKQIFKVWSDAPPSKDIEEGKLF